jgi:DNA polymerase I-like protein with 3'-5' exonuclease and polymerase domains
LYFNTNDLTSEQLAQSKLQTFRQLYGQISLEYSEHETFKMVNAIQTLFWHKYNSNDLETVIFNRKVKFNKTVDRTKVFNYMLQNFETELCSLFIDALLKGLQTFESKLVLYVYDSFLFDVKKSEAAQVFDLVKTVFGQIPYIIKSGPNYWEMSKR